jgi:hypothetical protein
VAQQKTCTPLTLAQDAGWAKPVALQCNDTIPFDASGAVDSRVRRAVMLESALPVWPTNHHGAAPRWTVRQL